MRLQVQKNLHKKLVVLLILKSAQNLQNRKNERMKEIAKALSLSSLKLCAVVVVIRKQTPII